MILIQERQRKLEEARDLRSKKLAKKTASALFDGDGTGLDMQVQRQVQPLEMHREV